MSFIPAAEGTFSNNVVFASNGGASTNLVTGIGAIVPVASFTGSPTILINGIDPFAQPQQTPGLACRLYPTPDGPAGVPSLPELRRALQLALDTAMG